MFEALKVVGRAFGLWWRELLLLTVLNLIWFALQLPIVTGPPATAAMYAVARRLADGDMVGARDIWRTLRQMFWPAWGWGGLNGLMMVLIVFNFVAYGSTPGLSWSLLRYAWGSIATVWFSMNLFFWPFWLAQADRRLVLTWRNALLLLFKAPGFALTLVVVCAVLTLVSVAITVPLAMALMAWLSLIGILAVDAAVKRPGLVEPEAGIELDAP